ncbi:hypothetical protein CK501_05740 [Halovibrio salipaludis]|uniref:Uncharacterized protein n=1 Tax=Halovibrio salipaludis TaxID=2032626 RepID=A0A2A2F8M3_9GAMM|nr:hypothetical protein [Halovibrio salipaludis]PAU81064.1 hypothetical protein CK501_05740 [Halovibrio salipaludis]
MTDKQEQDQSAARKRLVNAMDQARGRLPADTLALLLVDQADDALVEAIGTTGASAWLRRWLQDTTGTRVAHNATQGRALIGTADMEDGIHGY